jgi:hypothetical protein
MKRLFCFIGTHDWTCAAGEGIKPTQKQIDDGLEGFYDYATMYCKTCGHVYKPRQK